MTSIDRGLGRVDTPGHGWQCPIVVAHKFCVDKPRIKQQTIDAPLKETLVFLSGLHHCLILDWFLEEYICLFSSSIPSLYSAGHVRRPTMRDPVVVKLLKLHSKGQDSFRWEMEDEGIIIITNLWPIRCLITISCSIWRWTRRTLSVQGGCMPASSLSSPTPSRALAAGYPLRRTVTDSVTISCYLSSTKFCRFSFLSPPTLPLCSFFFLSSHSFFS